MNVLQHTHSFHLYTHTGLHTHKDLWHTNIIFCIHIVLGYNKTIHFFFPLYKHTQTHTHTHTEWWWISAMGPSAVEKGISAMGFVWSNSHLVHHLELWWPPSFRTDLSSYSVSAAQLIALGATTTMGWWVPFYLFPSSTRTDENKYLYWVVSHSR